MQRIIWKSGLLRRNSFIGNVMRVLLIILCFFASAAVLAKEYMILATPEAPYKMEADGTVNGIIADVISLLFEELNVSYKIVLVDSGSRIIREAKSGRADMVLNFSKKNERMDYLIYPMESYVNLTWNFFIRKEDEGKIKFEKLSDLQGLTVGATKDWSYTDEFWNSGLKLSVVIKDELQMQKLISKRIDVVPMNTVSALYEAKQDGYLHKISYLHKPLKSKFYYNAFSKYSVHPQKKRVMDNYDSIIKRMKNDGTIQKIYNQYIHW